MQVTIAVLIGSAAVNCLTRRLIMATREELLTEIAGIKDQVVKSRGEFVTKIGDLEDKLAANQPITLDDLADLKREVQASDDVNPDAAVDPDPESSVVRRAACCRGSAADPR